MIKQEPEFRPCIATERYIRARNSDGEMFGDSKKEFKALFHFWTENHKYFSNNVYAGAYTQPTHIVQTIAIVEYEDGSVHEVLPQDIRFVDRKVKNYDFKTE